MIKPSGDLDCSLFFFAETKILYTRCAKKRKTNTSLHPHKQRETREKTRSSASVQRELALVSADGKNDIGKSNRYAGACVCLCTRTRRIRVCESGSVNDCALPSSREQPGERVSLYFSLSPSLSLSLGPTYVRARAKARRNVKRARVRQSCGFSVLHAPCIRMRTCIHTYIHTYAYTPISRAIDGIAMRAHAL